MRRSLPWNQRHPVLAAGSVAIATALVLMIAFRIAAVAAFAGVVVFACMVAYDVCCRDVRV